MLRWIKIFIAILAVTISNKTISQDFTSKTLFVNQNQLYSESIFGKSLELLFKEESSKLDVQNKKLIKKLQLEEQVLTVRRETTPSKDFKVLAEEFNLRVEKVRIEQKEKAGQSGVKYGSVENMMPPRAKSTGQGPSYELVGATTTKTRVQQQNY